MLVGWYKSTCVAITKVLALLNNRYATKSSTRVSYVTLRSAINICMYCKAGVLDLVLQT